MFTPEDGWLEYDPLAFWRLAYPHGLSRLVSAGVIDLGVGFLVNW